MSSTDFITFLIVFILGVAAVVAIVITSRKNSKKEKSNYQKLANQLGLKLILPISSWEQQAFPKLSGNYEGRRMSVETVLEGVGEQREQRTKISLSTENEGYSLHLTRENQVLNIGKTVFGTQDIQINDPFFDKKFIIKSDNEMFAKRFLNQEIKRLLNDFYPQFYGRIVIEPFKIHFTQQYQIVTEKHYDLTLEVIDVLTKMANRAENLE
jgi:hypothetical protein